MNEVFAREAREALPKISEADRLLLEEHGREIYIGHEQREGWSGQLPFYLFRCEECGKCAKDYPHGHIERQYLLCSECGAHRSFVPWWAPIKAFWLDLMGAINPPPRQK